MALPVEQASANAHSFSEQKSGAATPQYHNSDCYLLDSDHPRRATWEAFIYQRFKSVHGAEVDHFLPVLLGCDEAGRPGAAVGICPGDRGTMFLEQYLEAPIEQLIARLQEQPVSRGSIVEIGNLVVTSRTAGLALMLTLTALLARHEFKWMVFTATNAVERMLNRLGYAPFYLADARIECLGDKAGQWGRYYKNRPRVLVGSIDHALEKIHSSPWLRQLFLAQQDRVATMQSRSLSLSEQVNGRIKHGR